MWWLVLAQVKNPGPEKNMVKNQLRKQQHEKCQGVTLFFIGGYLISQLGVLDQNIKFFAVVLLVKTNFDFSQLGKEAN